MTIAAPFLYVTGGIFLGLCVPGFYKHHLIGTALILSAGALIALAATHSSLHIPLPSIVYSHPSPKPPPLNVPSVKL